MAIKLPRINADEQQKEFPPKFNKTMEDLEASINKFDDKMANSDKKINQIDKRLDDFYGRLMEIFGIFIAIFSLILVTGYNLKIAKGDDAFDTALNVLIYLMPLTIVLLVFVLLLNYLRKK